MWHSRNGKKGTQWCLALVAGLFGSLGLATPIAVGALAPPDPAAAASSRKVIVTDLGETTESAGFVGDKVHYRMYYSNPGTRAVDIRIVDKLDAGLADVTVGDRGRYDPAIRTAIWDFRAVPPGASGQVDVTATLSTVGTVVNVAQLHFIKSGKLPGFDPRTFKLAKPAELVPLADLPVKPLSGKPLIIETNSVATQVHADPRLGWIPLEKDAADGALPKPSMKDSTTSGAMIHFRVPGVFVRPVKTESGVFHRFSMPGQASLTDLGRPELPIIGQMIEVPFGVDFSVEIVKSTLVSLDYYRVFPVQPDLVNAPPDGPPLARPRATFAIDKASYLTNRAYPGKLATIMAQDIGIVRGHRVVLLKVNPIQYNPVTFETRAYSEIEVRVKYSHVAQVKALPKRLYSRPFETLLKNSLLNYQNPKRFDLHVDDPIDGDPKEQVFCDYLILTTSTFYTASNAANPVVRLAAWKQRKGLRTRVEDTANITNGTTYDGIRSYLQHAYDSWAQPPSYVLLIGDADAIPVRYLTMHPSHGTLTGTDLYYSTLDGADEFPDIYLGRLPVDTLAQATAAVDKIIAYEQQPPNNANFYRDVLVSALFEDESGNPDDGIEDGNEDRPWIENVEDIRAFLIGQGYQVDRVYTTSSGWPADVASSQPATYENGTALPAALTPPGFGWNGTPNDVSNAINAGRFLVDYRDHGGRTSWSATGFDTGDADGLTNGALTPVIFSYACQNGWFDNETDSAADGTANNAESFIEHLVRNANGGAVAVVGATRNSWTGRNDYLMFGMHRAIWPAYVPNPPTTGYPAYPVVDPSPLLGVGQILTFGKVYMARAYNPATNRTITFEMYHLFGDPEMPLWIAAPIDLDVSAPAAIGSAGEQDFVVKVTSHATHAVVAGARVVLTRNTDIVLVRETDAAGIARFLLTAPASGTLDLTVSGLGYRPFLGTIAVSAGGATLNRLDPENGPLGQAVHAGGTGFSGNESVEIRFDGALLKTPHASGGSFGQPGHPNVDINVPNPHDLGPVNIEAKGLTSNRSGVNVFQVRSQNPIDLWTYDQWDSSTWSLHAGDNPTWDNPAIRLYDVTNSLVSSNNLAAGVTYTIQVDVHNDTDYLAGHVKVIAKWANFGLGQPPDVWAVIGGPVEIDVPAHSVVPAEIKWTTPGTGHLCVLAEIQHIEDINTANNQGQENCHVGPTSSPAEIKFLMWNPTKQPQMVYLELRQLPTPSQQENKTGFWGSTVIHPDPQLLQPGERREARVVIDPDAADTHIPPGVEVEYTLTGFVDGKVIGGANFKIKKR
jgi:hypothetical protein